MSIYQRVREIIKLEGSQSKFSKKIGHKQATISFMLKNESGAKYDFIMDVFAAYENLNPTWFIFGIGEMFLDDTEAKKLHEDKDKDKMSDKVIKLMEKRISTLEYELKKVDPDLANELGID